MRHNCSTVPVYSFANDIVCMATIVPTPLAIVLVSLIYDPGKLPCALLS